METAAKRADAQAVLNDVISTGKSMVRKLGAPEIISFIARQPGVGGRVSVTNREDSGDVGASSGIVLFTASYETEAGPVTRELVLRHAPEGENRLFYAYDMARQFKVQQALYQAGKVPVAEPLWLDPDGAQLGLPGFIMAFSPGRAPHSAAFARGPLAEMTTQERAIALKDVHNALAAIHATGIKAAGLEDFAMKAPGATAFERNINWYWQTWEWINVPEFFRLVPVRRWLLENMPDGPDELIHGDATLHNYMFHNKRLAAVVDWEMSCLSRAESDLSLQCLTNRIFAPPPGAPLQPPSTQEWLDLYAASGGRQLRHMDYYTRYAAYFVLVAVIALQRNMPPEMRAAQQAFMETIWQAAEA